MKSRERATVTQYNLQYPGLIFQYQEHRNGGTHILLTKSIDLNHKVLMSPNTYCVYKYRVHFESPGLKLFQVLLRSLNILVNIMHSLVGHGSPQRAN